MNGGSVGVARADARRFASRALGGPEPDDALDLPISLVAQLVQLSLYRRDPPRDHPERVEQAEAARDRDLVNSLIAHNGEHTVGRGRQHLGLKEGPARRRGTPRE